MWLNASNQAVNQQTALNTLWHELKRERNQSELEKQKSEPTLFAITEFLKISMRCWVYCFFLLPYHRSSWTVYVQQWHWLKGFLLFVSRGGEGGGSKLRHGLTLRPKPAASSNTVSEKWRQQRFNKETLHCTFRADSHHDRRNRIK